MKSTKQRIPFDRIQRDYLGMFYVAVPQWLFDAVLTDSSYPDSFVRFILNLWRATVGWQTDSASLASRDLCRRNGDGARYAHAMHAAGLIEYKPGKKGRENSEYKLLPEFGNQTTVLAFLCALRDALSDEKERLGTDSRLSAQGFADLVRAKMDSFLRLAEQVKAAHDSDIEEGDITTDRGLSVSSVKVARRVGSKLASEDEEWFRDAA